jgi:small subunit ribosomal protein S17
MDSTGPDSQAGAAQPEATPAPSASPAPSAPPATLPTPAPSAAAPAVKRRAEGAAPAASAPEARQTRRKVREGIVASNSMDKTVVVVIVERVRHARYAKTVQRTKRLYAHDEANDVKVGDRVRLSETRPLSKLKRWRVDQVLERAR